MLLSSRLPVEKNAASIAVTYRLRSLIENCGFRELKQAAYLKQLPKRKGKYVEVAAYLHIMLCVFTHTLFYAFLGWSKKKAPEKTELDCLRKWGRQESIKEGNKILIVAEGKYYAIFEIGELLEVFDVKQKYKIKNE